MYIKMFQKEENVEFKFVHDLTHVVIVDEVTIKREFRSCLRLRGGGGGKKKKKKKKGDLNEKVKSALAIYPASSTLIHKSITKFIEEHNTEKDIWTWESYTPEDSVEEEEVKVVKRKKIKRGKKEKEGTPTKPAKKKGKKTKEKKTKEKKKKKKGPTAEELRLAEIKAREKEEEDRIRLKEEEKIAKEIEKHQANEQYLRCEQLQISLNLIDTISKQYIEAIRKKGEEIEWIEYLKCDGLPNPCVCGQMNAYLQLWDEVIDKTTMEEATFRTREVLKLMNQLTTFIDNPMGALESQVGNWRSIYDSFCERQQKSLDIASYRILRDISNKMNSFEMIKADFNIAEEHFTICLWTMVLVPKPYPNPQSPPKPRVEVSFPSLEMKVLLPLVIDCYLLAIRVMYLKYDHLSARCSSYKEPATPAPYTENIYNNILNEWYSKLIYKYEQYCIIKSAEGVKVSKQNYNREEGIMPEVPYVRMSVSPSTHVIAEEDVLYAELRKSLITTVEPNVINLREYIVLGGIFFFDLYYQPPQPQQLASMKTSITRLLLPKFLNEVKFHVPYKPSSPQSTVQICDPAELEAENTKLEAEMDKLIFISLQLPKDVMWLDQPFICQWQKDKNVWSTAEIHNFKYSKETGSVTFHTTSFRCFAFAVNRYSNLPYQTWDLKPEIDGTVTLQITAAILVIDFNIQEDNVSIADVQNAPNNSLNPYLRQYFKLPKLKRILLELGIDIFPSFDAFCYVKESCDKHWPMEKHTYFQMAQLSCCYNFSWSRWNTVAGRRGIIMQMRSYKPDRKKQVPYFMLRITPLKADLITCTEVSESFLPEPVEGMLFYADLYTLFKETCSLMQKIQVKNTSPLLIGTVAELLQSTRILSFS